ELGRARAAVSCQCVEHVVGATQKPQAVSKDVTCTTRMPLLRAICSAASRGATSCTPRSPPATADAATRAGRGGGGRLADTTGARWLSMYCVIGVRSMPGACTIFTVEAEALSHEPTRTATTASARWPIR